MAGDTGTDAPTLVETTRWEIGRFDLDWIEYDGKLWSVEGTPNPLIKAAEDRKKLRDDKKDVQPIREFATGATRDTDTGKYEGFLNPDVLEEFAQYMHEHRMQKDGELRASDNWQKGMPRDEYIKSLWRHFHDAWKGHRHGNITKTMLCAIMFNTMGYMLEMIKEEKK